MKNVKMFTLETKEINISKKLNKKDLEENNSIIKELIDENNELKVKLDKRKIIISNQKHNKLFK